MPQETGVTELLANLSVRSIVIVAVLLTVIRLGLAHRRSGLARSVAELAESLLIAGVLVFLIIRPFFLQAFFIPSESMEPTLMGHQAGQQPCGNPTASPYPGSVNDHIFVNKLAYRISDPTPGDIVVFRAERKADMAGGHQAENVLIKRLVGVPGDTLEVKQDGDAVRLFRNGKAVVEPYVVVPMDPSGLDCTYACRAPLTLGAGEMFVMGDNRNCSNDGRFWGILPRERVIGKAALIFWPLNRIRLLR